jgi:uncharacterized protein (TIGR02594 family)
MGKPAARMGDTTAHGGTVALGKPTVLIGKMPASTMGDIHVCPMMTGPVPHVGGPITLGSTGVLICKLPAARVSDITVCVGPPSMPAMGCMTVLIGEVGSASQASSAAAAAAADSASVKGPKQIKPFPVAEPPDPRTENHWVECLVTDTAGLPLVGQRYKLTDPDGNAVLGSTSPEGKIRHDGYSQAGSFKVELCGVSNAKWSKTKGKPGENLTAKADAEGYLDGTPASVLVFEEKNGGANQRMLARIQSKVSGKKVAAEWALQTSDFPTEVPALDDPESAPLGDPPPAGPTEYFFFVEVEGSIALSDRATFTDNAEINLVGEDEKPLPDTAYEMHLADGTVRKGKVDKQGKAKEDNIPAGPYIIVLPEILIVADAPNPGEPDGKVSPDWVAIAKREVGTKEIKGKKDNPRILEYHAVTKGHPKTDEVAWCSSFACWVMEQAGYLSTKSSWAKGWLKWGKDLGKPAYGALAVFDYGVKNGKDMGGHVGFIVGKCKDQLIILGGNQSDQVCYSKFKTTKIAGYRVPIGYEPANYDLPEIKSVKEANYASTR